MDRDLAELIKISKAAGQDSRLVLGCFGNTSVKTDDGKYMYIKASGTTMKDMNEQSGWRRLKLQSVLAILNDPAILELAGDKRADRVTAGLLSTCDDETAADVKPSIESCLHAMLDKYVIHVHPLAVLRYVCAKNGRAKIEGLFGQEKYPPLWVPYVGLGYPLAKKIQKLTDEYIRQYGRKPAIMFLESHGLFTSAGSSASAMSLVRKVVDRCAAESKDVRKITISEPDTQCSMTRRWRFARHYSRRAANMRQSGISVMKL